MKTIGIIGAMNEEVINIRSKMDLITTKNILDIDFYLGKMHGKSIILVKSGIGKVNAAICTQILIDLYGADYCINTGVAGAISKELEIGDIVISSDLLTHDFDVTAFGHAPGEIPGMTDSIFKADPELIRIAEEVGKTATKNKIYTGRIVSGDQFISSVEAKQRIWNQFRAQCVEMEGVAVAQTCYLNKVPFVVIRSISDKADGNAENTYDKFLNMAAANSSEIIENMIRML